MRLPLVVAVVAAVSTRSNGASAAETARSWLDDVRPGSDDISLSVPPVGSSCIDFQREETVAVQAQLAQWQTAADCAAADTRFLVLQTWNVGGLASVAQEVSTALHIAIETGRRLVFQGDGAPEEATCTAVASRGACCLSWFSLSGCSLHWRRLHFTTSPRQAAA
jgi:hypothetical protein